MSISIISILLVVLVLARSFFKILSFLFSLIVILGIAWFFLSKSYDTHTVGVSVILLGLFLMFLKAKRN